MALQGLHSHCLCPNFQFSKQENDPTFIILETLREVIDNLNPIDLSLCPNRLLSTSYSGNTEEFFRLLEDVCDKWENMSCRF